MFEQIIDADVQHNDDDLQTGEPLPAAIEDNSQIVLSAPAVIPVHGKAHRHPGTPHQVTRYEKGRLNERELLSVNMLMNWVAEEQKTSLEVVQVITASRFGVSCVKELNQNDYEDVMKFLVDVDIKGWPAFSFSK